MLRKPKGLILEQASIHAVGMQPQAVDILCAVFLKEKSGGMLALYLCEKGGESNAKMHLALTPIVFALRLNTAIFVCFAYENRKFRASKKPTVGFFEQGLRQ